MSARIIIRQLVDKDYTEWNKLWAGYNEFYERKGPTAIANSVTDTTWHRFFADDVPMFALVVELDGKLLGFVHYLFHLSTSSSQQTCYLQDLFTSPEARGKGVGRMLIQGVYEDAQTKGASKVYWHTHETNETAMKLYDRVAKKSGFIVYQNI